MPKPGFITIDVQPHIHIDALFDHLHGKLLKMIVAELRHVTYELLNKECPDCGPHRATTDPSPEDVRV